MVYVIVGNQFSYQYNDFLHVTILIKTLNMFLYM
jgi:hypothetical protein